MCNVSADIIFLATRIHQLESELRKASPRLFTVLEGSDQIVDTYRRER